MKKYKFLLFDLDNTLFDFDRAEETAFYAAFSASGLVPDKTIYTTYHNINDSLWKQLERGEVNRELLKVLRYKLLLEQLCIPDENELSQKLSRRYFHELSKQRFLMDGAESICRKLHLYYKMFIITNGNYEVQKGRYFGSILESYFENIFISEKMGVAKPSPDYFDKVMNHIGERRIDRYCVIGDSLSSDIAGANSVGMDSIWLDRTGSGDTQGQAVKHILQDIRQLPGYLLEKEGETDEE